jgi:hypothetical protein
MTPRARLVWLVVALLLAGCGGRSYKTPPVSGRITLEGKPLANAMVAFVPDVPVGQKDRPPSSVGTTDADGRYSLSLNGDPETSGAVVGKHKVMITLGAQGPSDDAKPTFHKQLPQRYNRRTELECDVPGEGRADANFDLKWK